MRFLEIGLHAVEVIIYGVLLVAIWKELRK